MEVSSSGVVVSSSSSFSAAKSPSRSSGAVGGPDSSVSMNSTVSAVNFPPTQIFNKQDEEKPPQWQLDLLMEKLKQKSAQLKPLIDTSKNIRQAMMERRCILDQGDKFNLQKCLDSLQQSIKVNSLQSMVERLEMVARQLGLKFTPGATGHEWFISSDMFYLELLIDPNGVVEDVKIQHDGKTEQQSCPEIVESLKRTDFVDFTAHLEGLVSIYQLNADKKIKSKAYIALQALETDLSSMSSTYIHLTDAESVVMKSLLGLLQPRKGGHPVKLVYFVSPYEFLDVNSKSTMPCDVNTVLSKKLGNLATVNIQASTSHKLQMNTTVNIMRTPDGKSIPRYGTLNATNSTALPACFMVNLGKPIPICVDLLKTIQTTTGIDSFDFSNPQPILNLVTQHVSNGALDCGNNKGLFVALPDQLHCYFMTETPNFEGIMASTISFTLASQLPQVITILRQQLTFNTLLGSCVRVGSKPDLDSIVFEVNALSHQNLSVSFQHPLDDSLVTLEFDLRDVTHPHCRLHAVANATDIIPTLEEHACRVVQRSMSIPITLRAVIRRWQSMKVKSEPANPDFNIAVGGSSMNLDMTRINDRSCGAESGERRTTSNQQQKSLIPPGIVNFNNSTINSSSSSTKPPQTPTSSSSSYSISPVNVNYPSQPSQNPMDILSYMNINPFLNLSTQLGLSGNSSFPNLTPNMAMQMLASQMGQNPSAAPSPMLMGLLDSVGQQKRRKRKITTDSAPSPKPTPSPQTPRPPSQSPSRSHQKSPMRRQSDSSDGSGTEKNAINLLMSELGMDPLPDSRWNIDITPVNNNSSETIDDVDSLKKQGNKKIVPKRSISLDSHSSEEVSSGLQNLIENPEFKPLMTPSLSITPVSTTSNVNSLLASIRPGIEIIPLPNPVSIPTSITVTPILSKSVSSSGSSNDKQENKQKKNKDRGNSGKRKIEGNEGDSSRPSKIPFLDSKGRMSPSINFTKKPSSPNINNSPSKQMPASQGKPSVSTLKSVSSSSSNSPKYMDSSSKQKIKKPNPKTVKNLMNLTIPPLKAISPDITTTSINKPELSNSKPDLSKGDVKMINQVQMASAAVTAALQQAAANLVANASAQKSPIAKKGGLAAVIDKLKSVHSSTEIPIVDKKEPATTMSTMSTKDYLKVSSAITNDVLQQKKALSANTGAGGNPEYMIKGGQGLKLTINKTKLKDPSKSPKIGIPGLKSPISGMKKVIPGMKPLSALSAKLASVTNVTKKSTTPTKELKDMSSIKPNIQQMKTKDGKPRLESEDLTKKLFLPGAVRSLESGIFSTAPVFDPNKFQIPKKSRSNPNNGSSNSVASSSSESSKSSNNSETSSTSTIPSNRSTNLENQNAKENKTIVPLPNITPIPMDVDIPAPELTAETSSTTSSSSVTHRSEPPALIEVGTTIKPPVSVALIPPVPVVAEIIAKPEPDSTTTSTTAIQIAPPPPAATSVEPKNLEPTTVTEPQVIEMNISQIPNMEDFASPESPDPLNCVVNASTPQNIPTTPLNPTINEDSPKIIQSASNTPPPPPPLPTTSGVSVPTPVPQQQPSQQLPEEVDEDQLFIDDCPTEMSNSNSNSSASKDSNVTAPAINITDNVVPELLDNNSNTSKGLDEKSKSPEMPPPPPPLLEPTMPISNNSVPVASPGPPPLSIAPPASPKPVASPLSVVNGTTVSIASVHIVHSPQPNSPALIRSPLVQASPAASPYAIDDDLMDEALIGGSAK